MAYPSAGMYRLFGVRAMPFIDLTMHKEADSMSDSNNIDAPENRQAMSRLLVMYTRIDHLIMEICAERIAAAPDEQAKVGLAKQVGDESRHVMIQKEWLQKFGGAAIATNIPAQIFSQLMSKPKEDCSFPR